MLSSPAALLGSILFGVIGMGVFMYGKKMVSYRAMLAGGALMAYPYFVSETWLIYAIGCALCVALYLFRE